MIGLNCSFIQLVSYSIIAIIFFLVTLIIGLSLFNIKLNNNYKTYFLSSFLGLFTIISLFSIYFVGLKTINILCLLFLIFFIIKNGINNIRIVWPEFKYIIHLLYIFPFVFLLYGCYALPDSIENDVRYYSKIVYSLTEFQNENLYHFYNQYNQKFHGIMPYHYSELWLASFFRILVGVKSIIALKYIAYPFLISSIVYGMVGFSEKDSFLTVILFLGLSLLPLHIVSVFASGFKVYTDFWLRPNFIMYYYCILVIFFLVIEANWNLLYAMLGIIATTSIVILPCLFGGALFHALLLLYKKDINKKQFYYMILYITIYLVGMVLLYSFFSPTFNLLTNTPIKQVLQSSLIIWKPVLYTIVTLIIECGIIVVSGFFLNKFVVKNKFDFNIYGYVMIQVVIGVVTFQMLNQLDNTYQFSYFAFSAAGFLFIVTVTLVFINIKNKILKYIAILTIAVLCLVPEISKFDFMSLFNQNLESKNILSDQVSLDWWKSMKSYFDNNKNAKGGFVFCKNDLENYNPKSRNCLTIQMGSFLCYMTDECNLPSLTCRDSLFADRTNQNRLQFKKTELWLKGFPDFSNCCDVNEYIKNNKLDFYICSKKYTNIDSTLVQIRDSSSRYVVVYKK